MESALTFEQERFFVARLQQHQRRLQQLLAEVVQPEAWSYMDEAVRCFGVGAYDACVVMGWCAVTCYYRLVARSNYDLFAYGFEAQHGKGIGVPKYMKDWELIQACERIGMLLDIKGQFEYFQTKRNECAHPGRVPINPVESISSEVDVQPSEIVELLEQAVALLLKRRVNEVILRGKEGVGIILEFLNSRQSRIEKMQVLQLIDVLEESQYRFLAHRLRETFQRIDPGTPESRLQEANLLQVWATLCERLEATFLDEQLEKLASAMMNSVGCRIEEGNRLIYLAKIQDEQTEHKKSTRNPRGAIELAKLLWYPPRDSSDLNWRIVCEAIIIEIEDAIENGSLDDLSDPSRILRKIKDHAPSDFQERIAEIRSKIV